MRAISATVLCAFLIAEPAQLLTAQDARIVGRVHALGDSARVIAGADVTLLPAMRESIADTSGLRRVLSGSDGFFRFTGVADGLYQLRIRRLGFDVRDLDVQVAAQQDRLLDVPMRVGVQQLGSVVINGRKIEFPLRYAEAYDRMTHEAGDFFTREMIDSAHAIDLKSLLQRLPGVQANDRIITMLRCEGSTFSPAFAAAQIQVYVDGVRMTDPKVREKDALHVLRDISPAAVQLMEVYRSVSRIPGRYLADACAVILVWMK